MNNRLLRIVIVFLGVVFTHIAHGQSIEVTGTVTDANTREPLTGVVVILDDTVATTTDEKGLYHLKVKAGSHWLKMKMIGYKEYRRKFESVAHESLLMNVQLEISSTDIGTVVVSASKFEQKLNEVVVSMNVVKPKLIEDNNHVTIENAMEQVPGITLVDKQANIRGGSGFSYGAGTRVLLLVDEMPMLAADANDIKWSFLPVENIEQIEIIKGASSALFGSSALNGIINVRTSFPKSTPETKINFYGGIYDSPKDKAQRWWGKQDAQTLTGLNFLHSQKVGNLDIVFGGQINNDDSYRKSDNEDTY